MSRGQTFSEMIRIRARKSELQAKSRSYRPKVRVTPESEPNCPEKGPEWGLGASTESPLKAFLNPLNRVCITRAGVLYSQGHPGTLTIELKAFLTIRKGRGFPFRGGGGVPLTGPSVPLMGGSVPLPGLF